MATDSTDLLVTDSAEDHISILGSLEESPPSRSPLGYKSQSQFEEDTKAKQKAIDQRIAIAEKTCLCFMVDCTGSMSPWIKEVKKNIKFWSEKLHAKHTHMELHVAFVRYTDYDQPKETRTTTIDFTTDLNQFYTFVDNITTPDGVGGDAAEDVFGGLDAVVKLNWPEAATKVLIHITDAPCHGQQYHDPKVNDFYPKGDPANLQLDELMKKFVNKEIKYFFGYVKKSATLIMTKAFNTSMLAQSRNAHSIQQFDASNPSNLLDRVYRSVTCSINATLTSHTAEGSKKLHDFTIVDEIPNWGDLPTLEVLVTPPPTIGADTKIEVPCQPKKIKIAQQPFGEGKQKIAYHAYDEDDKEHFVVKRSKYSDQRSNVLKRCLETAQAHAVASKFSAEFNQKNRSRSDTSVIQFVPVGVMKVTTNGQPQYYTYEDYLGDGDYTKFNTNFHDMPIQDEDQLSKTCQTFSHFSWQKSEKRQVICDLQGVKIGEGSKVVLTDPAIHHTNVLCFGSTNFGKKGIDQFFRNHECNELCRAMKLKRPEDLEAK